MAIFHKFCEFFWESAKFTVKFAPRSLVKFFWDQIQSKIFSAEAIEDFLATLQLHILTIQLCFLFERDHFTWLRTNFKRRSILKFSKNVNIENFLITLRLIKISSQNLLLSTETMKLQLIVVSTYNFHLLIKNS